MSPECQTILIIDDDLDNIRAELLAPDLILLDVLMAEMQIHGFK